MPDSSVNMDMNQGNPQTDMPQWQKGRFPARVDKHGRSISQPNLHMQNEMMYSNTTRGKKAPLLPNTPRMCDFDSTRSGMYYQGQWPAWGELGGVFSQSMGNLGQERPHSNPTYNQMQQGHNNQFYEDNFQNWNSNSFHTGGGELWQNAVDRDGMFSRHQRRGSFDSREQTRHFEKPRGKYKGKYRDRSFDETRNTIPGHDNREKVWGSGYIDPQDNQPAYRSRDNRDGEFQKPDRRDFMLERGRGKYREGRSRGHRFDNGRPDKYSPESTSSTDSGGLKRRRDDESHHKPGKSMRDNDSNRVPPDGTSTVGGRRDRNTQKSKSRSRSYDRLHDQTTPTVDEGLSRSGKSRVTWSDQQPGNNQPTRTLSLDRLNEPNTFVKPDSTSGGKKAKKKGKQKNRRNYSPEDDINPRRKGGKSFPKNNGKEKEKSNTDTVLEKAEKLCKKLRNERERAKQQRVLAEKQKKMSKTEQINCQIEELSKRNKEHIKGHLESAESALLSRSTDEKRVTSQEAGNVELEPVHDRLVQPSKPQTPKEQKQTSTPKSNTEITSRIAQTRADIDAIRKKIETSVQSDMCNSSSSDTNKSSVHKPDMTNKPSRTLAQSEMLSPGAAYSPSNSVKKMDQNALLNMVKSPRSTKERLWLAEMLRSHAKSQTKLSFPRFNLKFSDLCTGSDRPNDLTDFDIGNLAPSVQLEIANMIEADTKPDVTELEKLLDQACEGNAMLDSNILSELGIFQSPEKPVSRPRSPSPVRSGSPVVTASQRYVDHRPSLSIEDLSTVQEPQMQEHLQISKKPTETPHSAGIHTHRTNILSPTIADDFTATPVANTAELFGNVRIKEEKIDAGYDAAAMNVSMPASDYPGTLSDPGMLPSSYSGTSLNTGVHDSNYTGTSNTGMPASSYAGISSSNIGEGLPASKNNTGMPAPSYVGTSSSNRGVSREYRGAEKESGTHTFQTRTGSPRSPVRKTMLPQTGNQLQTDYPQNTYSSTAERPERDEYQSTSRPNEVRCNLICLMLCKTLVSFGAKLNNAVCYWLV